MGTDYTPAARVFVDFVNPPSASGAPQWTEITPDVRGFDIKRGRSHALDRIEAGTATLTLDNTNGHYDPTNTGSPYSPNVVPLRRARIGVGYEVTITLDMPVSYWRLNERWQATTTSRDATGGVTTALGCHDTMGGSQAAYNVAVTGMNITGGLNCGTSYCVQFNGSSDYVQASRWAGNDAGEVFSLEAWVKPSTVAGTGAILSARSFNASGGKVTGSSWQWRIQDGKLTLTAYDGSIIAQTSAAVVASGAWQHVALTKSATGSGGCAMYVNGAAKTMGTNVAHAMGALVDGSGEFTSNNTYLLGAGFTYGSNVLVPSYFGALQDVAVYTSALAATAVAAHWTEGSTGLYDWMGFTGFVENWPQDASSPYEATIQVTCSDALAVLANTGLYSVYDLEVLQDSPAAYYKLDETQGAAAVDTSLFANTASYTGSATSYSSTGVAYDAGKSIDFPGVLGTDKMPGPGLDVPLAAAIPAVYDVTGGFTGQEYSIEAWINSNTLPPASGSGSLVPFGNVYIQSCAAAFLSTGGGGNFHVVSLSIAGSGFAQLCDPFGNNVVSPSGIVNDNNYHLVGVWRNNTMELWVNGASVGVSGGTAFFPIADAASIGKPGSDSSPLDYFHGKIDNVAIYHHALEPDRIAAHFNAAYSVTTFAAFGGMSNSQVTLDPLNSGWKNDTTGERIARVLDAISWPLYARKIDKGQTYLPPAVSGNTSPAGAAGLDYLNTVTSTEGGRLFVDGHGRIIFRDRFTPYFDPASTVSNATFGDTGSDLAYESVELDYDSTRIVNDVTINTADGLSIRVTDADSIEAYWDRSQTIDTFISDPTEAHNNGSFVVTTYKDPLLRIAAMNIAPLASYACWQQVLCREIADQLLVRNHRPAGNVLSQASLIEGMTFTYDVATNTWESVVNMSPVDATGYFVLDDPTYGLLDANALMYGSEPVS